MDFDKKKYISMEPVLQQINKECISFPEDLDKRNKKILNQVIHLITDKMKEVDALFKCFYTTVFYGGSYFDGLKVSSPEEYDLDFLLELPKFSSPKVKTSNIPGFVHVVLEQFDKLLKQPEFEKYKTALLKLVDNNHYLLTSKVSRWFEGVIDKALLRFPKENGRYVLDIPYGTLTATVHKGGPAFTFKIIGSDVKFDVDFVPCFVFKKSWPEGGYRKNPCTAKADYFVVPKQPKQSSMNKKERYWRLSFQEQERELINNHKMLKPALRLLKRLRDTQNHRLIASYYIKTVFLWEISERNVDIFNHSLSYSFMKMLYILQTKIQSKEILYFWNKKNNLIGDIRDISVSDIANKLKNIIKDINKHLEDPYTIAKYFGTSLENNMI